jgi:hypothetical protein
MSGGLKDLQTRRTPHRPRRETLSRASRFKHKEFAQYRRVARGAEGELLDLFREAHQRGLISLEDLTRHERLARRAMSAAATLIRYLETSPDPK